MEDTTIIAETVELFGIPIANVTLEQAVAIVDDHIARHIALNIGVVNAAKIVNMQKNEELRRSVLSSDIIFADGMSLVWAGRLLRRPLVERVTGIDLMYALLEKGQARGYRVYCLGAQEWVSEKVQSLVEQHYPGVVIAGRRNGYFNEDEEEAIANEIRAARPDILFVAMTSPKKENFMARWSDTMAVGVIHGVGGSFDVFAGKVARAPRVWQKLGLEWLYRTLQEPRRMWRRYLSTNSNFLVLLVKEWWKRSAK